MFGSYGSYMFFFFNAPPTTEIYTLSLHDALPISSMPSPAGARRARTVGRSLRTCTSNARPTVRDRKSTRLNSSHVAISYAVFCLKKKKRAAQLKERLGSGIQDPTNSHVSSAHDLS